MPELKLQKEESFEIIPYLKERYQVQTSTPERVVFYDEEAKDTFSVPKKPLAQYTDKERENLKTLCIGLGLSINGFF